MPVFRLSHNRRRKNCFFLIIGLMLLMFSVGCGGNSENNGNNENNEENIKPPSQFVPGTTTDVINATISPLGGVIEAKDTGTPIDGIKVEFPEGALTSDAGVFLGYNDGSLKLDETLKPKHDNFFGKALCLNVSNANKFNKPITISVPFEYDDAVPVPYYVDDFGKLHLVQLTEINREIGEFSFQTYHASLFVWIYEFFFKPAYAPGENDIVYTDFRPGKDGFRIRNQESRYNGGECLGMTSFSLWYFKNKKNTMGDFYSNYWDRLTYDLELNHIRGQHIIASRAHISIHQQLNPYYYPDVINVYGKYTDFENYTVICSNIIRTDNPVLLYLDDHNDPNQKIAHSILAYGFNNLDGTIFIYNPNNPGEEEIIKYNPITESFEAYSEYNKICFWGDGTIITEPYQNILDDAENNFQGSWDATIEITSHEYGQQITNGDINLIGIIESGQVLVTGLAVSNGSRIYSTDVGDDGFFNISIDLQSGINYLLFITIGNNFQGYPMPPLLNNMDSLNTAFVLYYVPPPISIGQGAPSEEIRDQFEDCYSRNGGGFLLSNPTSEVYDWYENLAQDFSNSNSIIIYSHFQKYAYLVQGKILEKYLDKITDLGFPISEQETGIPSQPKGTTCKYQNFENGAIEVFESGEHQGQAFVILNPFFQKWAELGYASHDLGYPTEDESGDLLSFFGTPCKYQNFEGGALEYIIYSDKVVEIHGAIFTRWESFRDIEGVIGLPVENPPGLPTGDEQDAGISPVSGFMGRYSVFEGGVIYWIREEDRTSVIGFEQPGAKAVSDKYHEEGGSGGNLGFPTSDDYCWNGGVRVDFENGYIHSGSEGAIIYPKEPQVPDNPVGRGAPTEEIKNQFIACYNRNGGEVVFFNPTSEVYNWNGYWAQDFLNSASIIVYNSLINYAYLVKDPILSKYFIRVTDLGPPVSEQATGDLSQPTQQATWCKYQNFENGAIELFESGDHQGQAFVILNPFFQKWADLGCANHDLGYPIEDESEELTSYFDTRFKYQTFEGGALEYLIASNNVVEIHGAIFTKWKNLNYAQSHLGLPIENEQEAATSSISGHTGRYSVFEGGIIHWIREEDRTSVIGFEQPGAKAIADKYHNEGKSRISYF